MISRSREPTFRGPLSGRGAAPSGRESRSSRRGRVSVRRARLSPAPWSRPGGSVDEDELGIGTGTSARQRQRRPEMGDDLVNRPARMSVREAIGDGARAQSRACGANAAVGDASRAPLAPGALRGESPHPAGLSFQAPRARPSSSARSFTEHGGRRSRLHPRGRHRRKKKETLRGT